MWRLLKKEYLIKKDRLESNVQEAHIAGQIMMIFSHAIERTLVFFLFVYL